MTDINDEMAIQYAVVRRTNPLAGVDDVTRKVIQRLREDDLFPGAGDAQWDPESDGGPDELTVLVRNFVLAVETDNDDKPG